MTKEEAIRYLLSLASDCKYVDTAIDALQADPVKHGKWVTDKDGYPYCSECGFSYGCIQCWHDEDTYFCPNCGAKMKG